ncbi:hypothetical protein [uncultured Mobiluncus sp.]|mgnify:FL=1|uniref:hypothetical protein n=1 Tax=uncultured Mobiluncus sp. TaxID=293425 RepID=UPI0025E6BCFA|nr:hypothetical protein [uncultured Mobiluncus sp.]
MPDVIAYLFIGLGVLSGLSMVVFRNKVNGTAQIWTVLLAGAIIIALAVLNLLQVLNPLSNVAIICISLGAMVSVFSRKSSN